MRLNKDMVAFHQNFLDFAPEGRFLEEVIHNFETPENPEEFLEAYCTLVGKKIKQPSFIECFETKYFQGCVKEPPNKYGFPNRMMYI